MKGSEAALAIILVGVALRSTIGCTLGRHVQKVEETTKSSMITP